MKKIIPGFALLISGYSFSQNVGIGTIASPTEKLDVNGNINMSGNLRVNNTSGQPNQVLMTNGSGKTVWMDIGEYKNVAGFSQSDTWTVPPGVTKIRIEAWGGGGGGAAGGGGAGGTYILTQEIIVSPGMITLTIGAGGAGAISAVVNGTSGGSTAITGAFGIYTAAGGSGGTITTGGNSTVFVLNGDPFIQFAGQSGNPTTYEYAERTAGQFVEVRKYGSGGGIAPFYNNGGPGAFTVIDLNTTASIKSSQASLTNIIGAGGGGGGNLVPGFFGADGVRGMVIIHY